MKALDVDLRTPSRPPKWAWGVVGLLAAIAVGMGLLTHRESRKLDELKSQLADLQRQLAEPSIAPIAVIQKSPYDASAREMLALATSEWPAMLTALESVTLVGVTPTAVEIAPAERWIRVEVEFADYAKLLEYVDALNAGNPKPRWGLVQAQSDGPRNGTGVTAPSTATVRGTW